MEDYGRDLQRKYKYSYGQIVGDWEKWIMIKIKAWTKEIYMSEYGF